MYKSDSVKDGFILLPERGALPKTPSKLTGLDLWLIYQGKRLPAP
jgi:hypothetical protein